MSSIKNRLTEYLIEAKIRPVMRRLNQTINFPIEASAVQKVLVILPRNMAMLETANRFVQALRKSYPNWRVELFDVDKLSKTDLNRMHLPRPEILHKLKKADYHFVMDLNDSVDQLSGYIALMTEAPYRLQIHGEGSFYYNIAYHPQRGDNGMDYDSLLEYLAKLFVKH